MKPHTRCAAVLLVAASVSCGSAQRPKDIETDATTGASSMAPEPEAGPPVQKVALGGTDETGDYVAEVKLEFETCMAAVFVEIAVNVGGEQGDVVEPAMERGRECFNDLFQSMKGGINIHPDDIEEVVVEEEKRQARLDDALAELAARFEKAGMSFEIGPPGEDPFSTGWDTTIVPGRSVQIGDGARLLAYPLVPAVTTAWGSGEDPAHEIVFASEDCMLFLAADVDPGTRKRLAAVFGVPQSITEEVEGAGSATKHDGFILIESDSSQAWSKLESLKKTHGVAAIVQVRTSASAAFIHTGGADQLPVVLKHIYSWHGF